MLLLYHIYHNADAYGDTNNRIADGDANNAGAYGVVNYTIACGVANNVGAYGVPNNAAADAVANNAGSYKFDSITIASEVADNAGGVVAILFSGVMGGGFGAHASRGIPPLDCRAGLVWRPWCYPRTRRKGLLGQVHHDMCGARRVLDASPCMFRPLCGGGWLWR